MLIRIRDLVQKCNYIGLRGYQYSYTFVDVEGNILALRGDNFGDLGKEIEKCSEVMLYNTFRSNAHLYSILSREYINNFNCKITLMYLYEVLYDDAYDIRDNSYIW